MANMILYIIKRILVTIPMIFLLVVLTWILAYLMPGDPTSFFPPTTPVEQIEYFRELWGLNEPWYTQLGIYLKGFIRGDLGESVQVSPGSDVLEYMLRLIPVSMQIALIPIFLIPFFGIVIGYSPLLR